MGNLFSRSEVIGHMYTNAVIALLTRLDASDIATSAKCNRKNVLKLLSLVIPVEYPGHGTAQTH